jgi:hypothetical protein
MLVTIGVAEARHHVHISRVERWGPLGGLCYLGDQRRVGAGSSRRQSKQGDHGKGGNRQSDRHPASL